MAESLCRTTSVPVAAKANNPAARSRWLASGPQGAAATWQKRLNFWIATIPSELSFHYLSPTKQLCEAPVLDFIIDIDIGLLVESVPYR